MTTTTASPASRRAPWWQTASRIGLILLGAFNIYAAAADLAPTAGTGLPSDHTGTFAALTGRTWASFKAAQPGAAHYVTLLERGYALHELTFATILARSLICVIALPVLLLAQIPALALRHANDTPPNQDGNPEPRHQPGLRVSAIEASISSSVSPPLSSPTAHWQIRSQVRGIGLA
jgi:hypothetical protein